MCGTLSNVRRDVKNSFLLPNGDMIKFGEVDAALNDVPRETRGEMSRKVLASLPKNTRFAFEVWVGTTTKKAPVPQEHKELITFLTVADFAIKHGLPVGGVVEDLVSLRRPAADVLRLRA